MARYQGMLDRRPIALPYDDYVIPHAAQMELLVMPLEDVIHTDTGTSTRRGERFSDVMCTLSSRRRRSASRLILALGGISSLSASQYLLHGSRAHRHDSSEGLKGMRRRILDEC